MSTLQKISLQETVGGKPVTLGTGTLAKQAGGGDNVTVIVLRYAARPAGALARLGKWFKKSA